MRKVDRTKGEEDLNSLAGTSLEQRHWLTTESSTMAYHVIHVGAHKPRGTESDDCCFWIPSRPEVCCSDFIAARRQPPLPLSLSRSHHFFSLLGASKMVSTVESTIESTSAFLKQKLPDHFQSVRLGIICGSGLGGLVDTIDPSTKIEFAYRDIPGFAVSTGRS